jgi:DNA recombination protein RmuC
MDAVIPVLTLVLGLGIGLVVALWLGKTQLAELRNTLRAKSEEVSGLREENQRLAKTEATREAEKCAMEEKLALLEQARENLSDAFKALSSEALKSNNRSFLDLAKATLEKFQETAHGDLARRQQAIGELVKPVRESLDKVGTSIQELEKARTGAYAGLQEQIKSLMSTQSGLQTETANLVRALRTPNVRGRWGEMQLERAVEFAGMVEHCDFLQQASTTTEEGRLRPDLIVKLPNGRNIIVDAKAPLQGYLDALEATEDSVRDKHLQAHARQIRDHITKLSAKSYWKQFEPTPEFVVLFLPGEAFFSAALEQDAELIQFGTGERVILATPTTLIALLKAVAYGWQQEKVAAHAKTVGALGRELYERFGVLAGHFARLGGYLDKAVGSYNDAVRSTETRLLVTARKFKDLGSGSEKSVAQLEPIDKITLLPQAAELSEAEDEAEQRKMTS